LSTAPVVLEGITSLIQTAAAAARFVAVVLRCPGVANKLAPAGNGTFACNHEPEKRSVSVFETAPGLYQKLNV